MATERIARAVLELVTDSATFFADTAKAKREGRELGKVFADAGKDAKSFGKDTTELGKTLTSGLTVPLTAVAGGLAAVAINSARAGDGIAKGAREAGLAPRSYQELTFAIGQVAEVTDEELTKSFARLSKTIGEAAAGNKQAQESLEKLGFTEQQILSGTITTEQAFDALNTKLQGTRSAAEATALAGDLLGDKIGPKLAGALRESGAEVNKLRDEFRQLGLGLSDEQLAAAEKFGDQSDLLGRQLSALGNVIGAEVVPVLTEELMPFITSTVVPGLRTVATVVGQGIKVFTELPRPVQLSAIGLAALVVAAGPLLVILGQVAGACGTLITVLGKLSTAYISTATASTTFGTAVRGVSGVLLGPVGLVAALTAGAVAFTLWKVSEIREKFRVMHEASELLKQAVDNADEARQVLEAFAAGQRGDKPAFDMKTPQTVVDAYAKGAEAAGRFSAEQGVVIKRLQEAGAAADAAKSPLERLRETQARLEDETRKYNEALKGKRDAIALDIASMDQSRLSLEQIANIHRVSVDVVARLKSELEAKEKSDKKAAQTEEEAARIAERRRATIERQEEAFAKLGLVTERYINDALADLLEMEAAARDNGANMDMVLRAMLPTLTELRTKAAQSGVEVAALGEAFDRAQAAQDRFDASLKAVPWSKLLADMRAASGIKKTELIPLTETEADRTKALAEAYTTLGVTSRRELRDQATAAIFAYNEIRKSGTATPKEIQAAFEAMVDAVNKANGKIPSYWQSVVVPGVRQGLDSLIDGFSSAFAGMLTGARSFWDSFKQSALNTFAEILDAFINGLIKRMVAALAGMGGGGGGWGSILQGALNGGGGGGGMGGGVPYGGILRSLMGIGGASGIGVTTGVPAGLAGVGATGIGPGGVALGTGASASGSAGFLAGTAGTALGIGAVGGAGFGLGYFLSEKFGKTAGAIGGGLGGAGMGALIGTAVFPGVGTALGAGIGALAGVVGGLLGGGDDGDKARDKFIAQFGGRGTGEGSGFGTLQGQLGRLGDRGNALFDELIGADSEKKSIAAIEKIIAAFNTLEFKQIEVDDSTKALLKGYEQLQAQGLTQEAAIRAQAGSYSALYNQIVATGTKAPSALHPIFLSLVELGLLVDKNGEKVIDLGSMFEGAAAVSTIAAEKMRVALQEQIKTLDTELKSLTDSIANEAPEEVIGVIEAQARERIASIERERESLMQQLEAAGEQAGEAAEHHAEDGMHAWDPYPDHVRAQFQEAWDEAVRIAEATGRDLIEVYQELSRDLMGNPIRIPVEYDMPDQPPSPPRVRGPYETDDAEPDFRAFTPEYRARGGLLARVVNWRPLGADIVPAMLSRSEGIVSDLGMRELGAAGLQGLNAGLPLRDLARLGMTLGSAEVLPREASGTASASPPTIIQQFDVRMTVQAWDGEDVQRTIRGRHFQEEMKRQILLNTQGLGEAVKAAAR